MNIARCEQEEERYREFQCFAGAEPIGRQAGRVWRKSAGQRTVRGAAWRRNVGRQQSRSAVADFGSHRKTGDREQGQQYQFFHLFSPLISSVWFSDEQVDEVLSYNVSHG